ncbi:MAG: asparagine synthase (glutamine-hydrolyzing) [Desulfomonile tiedjei]|nr:asparagine synthase (glutamine-hydrolyzing) [Desulfomonile tiedjei]
MCGIVGLASRIPIPDRNLISSQRDTLVHRGPDDAGTWWSPDSRVGLAHRRLSIIDLSPAGRQPMLDGKGELCITFNGEIYNFPELRKELIRLGHHFRSASDTEVILEAYREWGTDCLERLNGMFAFGLYDMPRQRLFLARDRAGEKPLFYSVRGNSLVFASELKAILADPEFPRRIDPLSLKLWLEFGYVPGESCILQGVRKLAPAHALTWDVEMGNVRGWRYWSLAPMQNDGAGRSSDEDLVEDLHHLLEDSVRRQLVSDVPVGVLLSGGVDSSLVTAMAAHASSNVKTFTIRFPDYPEYDETEPARLIAEHFSTDHYELAAEPTTWELLPKLALQYDEPIVDSSMIPTYLVSRLVRSKCTVALGGDGGDELFGGYSHYGRLLWAKRNLGWIPRPLKMVMAGVGATLLPTGFRGRNYLMGLKRDLSADGSSLPFLFDREARKRLLARDLFEATEKSIPPTANWRESLTENADLLDRACRIDFHTLLPEDILVKVDRASMLNSLEVRAPFLDHRIIEFAFGMVPSQLKATGNGLKILPKMLGKRLLPASFQWDRKQGFSIPLDRWLRTDWRDPVEQTLLHNQSPFWNPRAVRRLWQGHLRGYSNSERVFGLLMFELWRKAYGIEVP